MSSGSVESHRIVRSCEELQLLMLELVRPKMEDAVRELVRHWADFIALEAARAWADLQATDTREARAE